MSLAFSTWNAGIGIRARVDVRSSLTVKSSAFTTSAVNGRASASFVLNAVGGGAKGHNGAVKRDRGDAA
jgi:hypothetical protein